MKWFKFESQEEETIETESSSMLVYLSPEALKNAVIVDDFASFQDSPECIPGGRLFEVSRQYSYRLRQAILSVFKCSKFLLNESCHQ